MAISLFKPLMTNTQKTIIRESLNDTSFNPYYGDIGFAKTNDKIDIWYEDIGPKNDTAILLIMGHSFTALGWPDYFMEPLMKLNQRIVRIDNRSIGLSSRFKKTKEKPDYTTRDMAKDVISVMDHLNIKKSHILGVSMGGVVAQDIAIDTPSRVLSLCLAMTTGELFGKGLPKPNPSFVGSVLRIMSAYKGKFDRDHAPFIYISLINALSNTRIEREIPYLAKSIQFEYDHRRSWHFKFAKQQNKAMTLRGGRWNDLADLKIPCLIIHGDKDPIFPLKHAKVLREKIENSRLVILPEMGHFMPLKDTERVAKEYRNFLAEISPSTLNLISR